MKSSKRFAAGMVVGAYLLSASLTSLSAGSPKKAASDEDKIRAVLKIFNQAIATAPLQEAMPLE